MLPYVLPAVIFAFCQQKTMLIDYILTLFLDPDSVGVADLDPGMQRRMTARVLPVLKSWIFSLEG